MELTVSGKKQKIDVSEAVFDRAYSEALVHQVVTAYMATGRAGTKAQKNRAAVSGGGAKPWKQKGTGRARAGTIRSPIWVGGGKTFAASPRDFTKKVNTKMYRAAMKTILSELYRNDRLVVVDGLDTDNGKTKEGLALLAKHDAKKALLIAAEPSDNLVRSTNNIPYVYVTNALGIDPVSLVAADKVLITVDAIKQIEEWLA
ncbi:50S ribosomal protein L4 [Marinicella gelatinilytica]|uniref:50S ribosomal protein L4 n=1 Tax=Marinicella gelatinilytica TaxID=2996017 RepID=UPI0022608709|nr:50S ribosomal protein L4 [Marinicella gelatinilytica]MCX7546154.1 50S ribosomal protein L4 [Marinicella gelatinilytica]